MAHVCDHLRSRGVYLRREDARAIFDELSRLAVEQLAETGRLRMPGLARFAVRERAARTGRNPRTGERVEVPAGQAVTVRVAKQLKDAVERMLSARPDPT